MARATLDGRAILDGTCEWELRPGVKPCQSEFLMTPEDASALVSGGLKPVTLSISGMDGTASFDFLYVIEDRPGPNRYLKLVRVVDRRWFWDKALVSHSFNMRRNIGVKRVSGGTDSTPEIDPVTPDVWYAPWSLYLGQYPWSARRALEAAWESVQEIEKTTTGVGPGLEIAPEILTLTGQSLPLEDVVLNDPGDVAVARLLSYIPGANVTVTADGTVRVYSEAEGGEQGVIDSMGAEQEDGGHVEFVTNDNIRPREVRIYFETEVEMLFHFEEVATAGTSLARGSGDPWVDNVLPVTDYSLPISGKRPAAQGAWITVSQAIQNWGSIPNWGSLSYDIIRKAIVPYMDLWVGPRIAALGDAANEWGARIAALQQHFRRTFRVNRLFTDRVKEFKPYRLATRDPENGQRSPAVVFQNWAVVASQRFLAAQFAAGADSYAYARNYTGYDANDATKRKPAPAKVSVVDNDQGIIHLDFMVDVHRLNEQYFPSKLDNIPNGKISNGHLAWNAISVGRSVPQLSASHSADIIMTIVPGAPNGKRRLYKLTRKPSDVAAALPASLSAGLSNANGPPVEIYIGAGWETARIAWKDEARPALLRALGVGDSNPGGVLGTGFSDIDPSLVINLGSQASVGDTAASLDAIASSVAASVYAGFADKPEGEKTTSTTHAARIVGFIESVLHRVSPEGETTTTIRTTERKTPLDIFSLLPQSTRNLIFKLAKNT